MASPAQDRTEQKLRYAKIHLEELRTYPHATSNDDWENAHQESCFYHLAGAVDALLHEINDGYSLGLPLKKVTWKTVTERLKQSNQTSPAFDHLAKLRCDKDSWLAWLFEWRNHGTHRGRLAKMVNLSNTPGTVDNEFKDPETGQVPNVFSGLGCLEVLTRLANDVRKLIDDRRSQDPRL